MFTGFRIQNSWKGCFHSVFGCTLSACKFISLTNLHCPNGRVQICTMKPVRPRPNFLNLKRINQTPPQHAVNIHSHLWGAVMFGSFLVLNEYFVLSKYPSASLLDTFMVSIFLCAAVLCMSFSALYHISGSHSQSVNSLYSFICAWKDPLIRGLRYRLHVMHLTIPGSSVRLLNCTQENVYLGLTSHLCTVMIVGSFFPALYYAFYCESHLQTFYMSLIVLSGAGQCSSVPQLHTCPFLLIYMSRCNIRSPLPRVWQAIAPRRPDKGLHRPRSLRGRTLLACPPEAWPAPGARGHGRGLDPGVRSPVHRGRVAVVSCESFLVNVMH